MTNTKRLTINLCVAVGCCFAAASRLSAQEDHWVAVGNQATSQYEIYDPTVTDWNSPSALKWTFAPTTSGGWTSAEVAAYSNPSDIKLRWLGSSLVVVSCASGGLATMATYTGGSMKWSLDVGGSNNPHSVELLPDGNVAVAASAGNWVRVYTASQGSRSSGYAQFNLTGAHAVLWDPLNNELWVIGDSILTALVVGGTAASPTLTEDTSREIALQGHAGGHDLSPYWGDFDRLWQTQNYEVNIYQKSTKHFTAQPGAAYRYLVKGCGNQPSGEIVQCVPNNSLCTLNTWCTPNVDFYQSDGSYDYTRTRTGAAFYKCRIFWPDYQPVQSHPAAAVMPTWYLRDEHTSGSADYTFTYGESTDNPITGDWDGNGTVTVGVYRNVNDQWVWYLRNSNTSGTADITFTNGTPSLGDIPVTGDWDGNGTWTTGYVETNSTGDLVWYLRNSNSSGPADISFIYGQAGDTPIVGDWDGNGTFTPGVVRVVAGLPTWYLRNSNSAGAPDITFTYGSVGDLPVAGDWDGNGTWTPGIVRGNVWYCRDSNTTGSADFSFTYGSASFKFLTW